MSIADWFRPKWRHSNRDVRLAAIARVTDQCLLGEIARSDWNFHVRAAAAGRITDQTRLADLAKNSRDYEVRVTATERLTDQSVLADLAKHDESSEVRKAAAARVRDQSVLADISKNGEDYNVGEAAGDCATNPSVSNEQSVLANMAKSHGNYSRVVIGRVLVIVSVVAALGFAFSPMGRSQDGVAAMVYGVSVLLFICGTLVLSRFGTALVLGPAAVSLLDTILSPRESLSAKALYPIYAASAIAAIYGLGLCLRLFRCSTVLRRWLTILLALLFAGWTAIVYCNSPIVEEGPAICNGHVMREGDRCITSEMGTGKVVKDETHRIYSAWLLGPRLTRLCVLAWPIVLAGGALSYRAYKKRWRSVRQRDSLGA